MSFDHISIRATGLGREGLCPKYKLPFDDNEATELELTLKLRRVELAEYKEALTFMPMPVYVINELAHVALRFEIGTAIYPNTTKYVV